jgi:hypothetical protein
MELRELAMDVAALERNMERNLSQRWLSLRQTGDLESLLSITIFGGSRGDLEHLERIHTLLYEEVENQSSVWYRRVLKQLDRASLDNSPEVITVDRVLRVWSQTLIQYSLKCVQAVSDRLDRRDSPDFNSLSEAFSLTGADLLDEMLSDAKAGAVKGEFVDTEKKEPLMVKIESGGTGNIINVTKYMTDVTNQVNQNVTRSGVSEEVKELMKSLTGQVHVASSQADTATAEQLGKNLEALGKELKSTKP